jgi:serine/threonine protein phosphatase PrpC
MTLAQNNFYTATRVVSPMTDGEEKKDQDRAAWWPAALTASMCDGVTSSPFSAEAAELVSQFSPVIFSDNNININLKLICDLLMTLRNEKLQTKITTPSHISEQMQQMLQQVAQENIKSSFQTTLVGAKFVLEDIAVVTSVIRCGDSMFLAFSPDGEVLAASPLNDKTPKPVQEQTRENISTFKPFYDIGFGPGDELIARVLGPGSDYLQVAAGAGIKETFMDNWFLCAVVDKCNSQVNKDSLPEYCAVQLMYRELLLVPRYLVGAIVKAGSYVRFHYSPAIRMVKSAGTLPRPITFQQSGSTTAVLPDHFYTGQWTYFRDRFPLDAHFVLASDGFFNCFKDSACLWSWLINHRQCLQDDQERINIMEELHKHLHREHSDDDISFVWVYPQETFGKSSEFQNDLEKDGEIHNAG